MNGYDNIEDKIAKLQQMYINETRRYLMLQKRGAPRRDILESKDILNELMNELNYWRSQGGNNNGFHF